MNIVEHVSGNRKYRVTLVPGSYAVIECFKDDQFVSMRRFEVGDEVLFRIAVGGATGHKAFARDLGILVKPSELNRVVAALVRVYIAHGNQLPPASKKQKRSVGNSFRRPPRVSEAIPTMYSKAKPR